MTEENKKIISDCEFEVRRLLLFAQRQKEKIAELTHTVESLEQSLTALQEKYETLNAAYTNLKTARMLQISDSDIKNAKARIAKLVREIDKCIALLNI